VAGLAAAFGSGAMTNSIGDIKEADVIMLIGSNPDPCHPVIGLRINQAVDEGAKLLVVDPRGTDLARRADIWLSNKPGSDVALLNAMCNVIIEEDLWDHEFVEQRTEDFEELRNLVDGYTPEYAAGITGISEDDIRRAARLYASPGKNSAIYYGMGLAHYAVGTDNVKSVGNLAMLCGKLGKPGNGVNPLRGQNNVQGACDMGALFNTLPGYSGLTADEVFARYEKEWGVKLPRRPGKAATEVWDNIINGNIKSLYIMGEDPVLADPNAGHAVQAIKELDFLLVQDIFLTDTARMADVVLPAACFAEKDGTFTCSERRVQRVRKAVSPPGKALPDWEIFCRLSRKMGYNMHYSSPAQIFEEIASLLPQYAGISYERIESEGLQWPCPDKDHPGTPVLHVGKFTKGRGMFVPEEYVGPGELPDEEYPYILTTGRELEQYNFGSMTRKTRALEELCPEGFAEINPADAGKMNLADGDWLQLTSRRGTVNIRARLTERSQPGTVFVPYHFAEAPINLLTFNHLDRLSRSPEYKVCAIKVEKGNPES
ncbi:MAG: molybdopterin oxidoreductase family protein, partial [Desulfurivibrionaceae bacterium]